MYAFTFNIPGYTPPMRICVYVKMFKLTSQFKGVKDTFCAAYLKALTSTNLL